MPEPSKKKVEALLLGLGANEQFRDELQKLSFIDTILSDRRKFIEDLKAFRTDFVPGIVSGEEFDAFLKRLGAGPAKPSAEAGAETPKDTFLTHKNPWESEYRRIAKIVGEDECRTLKCGYAFMFKDERNLPIMKEKEYPCFAIDVLPEGFCAIEVLDKKMFFSYNRVITQYTHQGKPISEMRPLLTYAEALKHFSRDPDSSMVLSNPEAVKQFDAKVAEINAELERIKNQNDIESLDKARLELYALFERKERCGTGITEKYMLRKLKGRILVDLGGGPSDTMLDFARRFKADTYINVDIHFSKEGRLDPELTDEEAISGIKVKHYGGDMLLFLSRLPDNSCNFTINGIRSDLIDFPRFHEAVAREIARATAKGGIVFGWTSDCFDYLYDHKEMQPRFFHLEGMREIYLFEKKE